MIDERERRAMRTGGGESCGVRGPMRSARSALAYLALVPVLLVVALGGYFAVRLALAPAGGARASTGPQAASSVDELTTVDVVVERARAHLVEQRTQRAEALLLAALARFGLEQRLWLLYAEVLMDLGRFDGALAAFETAIDIGPDHPEYRNAAGTLASQLGDRPTAEIHWGAGQRMDPTDPRFPFFLAQLQRDAGRADEARANLLIAVRLDPDLAEGWGSLASIAFEEGHYAPALQHLERAKALEPARPLWRVMEARVHRRRGEPQRAAAVLSAIPDDQRLTDPLVLRELGLCFGMMRQPGEAAETYLEAIAFITLLDDEAELIYSEDGTVAHDPRTPGGIRAELHHEAALWLERAADPDRARAHAERALRLGHGEAGATLERLAHAGEGAG